MEINVNPKASEWILKQPWLSQFVDNCMAGGNTPAMTLSYLLGNESPCTVNEAFYWAKTPEGRDFWSNIDDEMSDISIVEDWDDFDATIEI
jgi:hypothetical protein